MSFDDYIEAVKESVSEVGYDAYRPSLCILGLRLRQLQLDEKLSDGGEAEVAREWAQSLIDVTDIAYLSYRTTNRMIFVDRIERLMVVDRVEMEVRPKV